MFHKAIHLEFLDGTAMAVTFLDGAVKKYDISAMFSKYPQLEALKDRDLFLSGRLMGAYGIMWTDELDLETETIYEDGETIETKPIHIQKASSQAVLSARAKAGLSQKELSELTGIDQSDISKIERGVANPSVATLERIAAALGGRLSIAIETA